MTSAPGEDVRVCGRVVGKQENFSPNGPGREPGGKANHGDRAKKAAGVFEDRARAGFDGDDDGKPPLRVFKRRDEASDNSLKDIILHRFPECETSRMMPILDPVRRGLRRFSVATRSLRFKATVAVASFIVMISLLLSALFVLYVERMQRAEAVEHATSLARMFAKDVAVPLAEMDAARLGTAFRVAMRDPVLLLASISDSSGKILRSSGDVPDLLREFLDPIPSAPFPPVALTTTERGSRGLGFVLDVVAPVFADPLGLDVDETSANPGPSPPAIGSVRVVASLAPMLARVHELRWRAAIIALAMIVLGTVGTTFLVAGLIGPIQDLARATQRVAEGDFEVHMDSPSDDELGVLTGSFNEMTHRLQRARERQESWSRELEKRVREKTREVEESRRHLENIVENVGASVIVADLEGTIVSTNSHSTRIFGIKPEWIVGRSLQEFTCDPQRKIAALRRLLEGGGTVTYEATFLLDETRSMELLVTHTILRDPDGKPAGILQITKDITALKTMEKRLVDTERLSAMGEMAGEIGHELNNYLTAIGGRAELIPLALAKSNYDLARQNSSIIAEQVARMRVLTDGLLDSARKETSPREIDFDELLRRMVEFVRPQNRYKGIDLVVSDSGEGLLVYADPQQLSQVILNLLSNAADAIHGKGAPGGTIRVESFQRGALAGFRVSDDGAGIEERALARIFEPRFTTKSDGNGFGLAVCHRVIRNHGGDIHVETSPGRGSTFTVTLPKTHSPATSPAFR